VRTQFARATGIGETTTDATTIPFVYDPSTSEFQQHIWDIYRTLRDEHPVYFDSAKNQYVLSRFDDVWRAVNDWEVFSSIVEEAENFLPQMIYMDPQRHTRLRALVSRAFTPKRIAEIEPIVRTTTSELLDRIAERGRCELQHDYAAVLPSVVIARMIGIPDEHVETFRSWTESFLEIQGPQDYLDALKNCYELFADLLAERRRSPRDDLMSALLVAEVDGQQLTDEELLGFCFLLILAGNDTTSSLIGNGIVLLAGHPEPRAMLGRDPALWPPAIEEMNRIESPVQALPRKTMRDIKFHGRTIPAGSRVILVWGAANHDDREFSEPERFDVTRTISRHLAFAHGIHFCLGANLARLEARIALEAWHARFPDYDLDGQPRRITSIWARAFSRIPVRIS
jgi:cytochrome P450 family 130